MIFNQILMLNHLLHRLKVLGIITGTGNFPDILPAKRDTRGPG